MAARAKPIGVCHAFQTGDCTRGSKCKFAHELSSANNSRSRDRSTSTTKANNHSTSTSDDKKTGAINPKKRKSEALDNNNSSSSDNNKSNSNIVIFDEDKRIPDNNTINSYKKKTAAASTTRSAPNNNSSNSRAVQKSNIQTVDEPNKLKKPKHLKRKIEKAELITDSRLRAKELLKVEKEKDELEDFKKSAAKMWKYTCQKLVKKAKGEDEWDEEAFQKLVKGKALGKEAFLLALGVPAEFHNIKD